MRLSGLRALQQPLGARLGAGPPSVTGPIGLDFSRERLNLLQMERNAEGLGVRAVSSVPYTKDREALLASPREVRKLIRSACSGRAFRGRRVVTAMPVGTLRIFNLTYEVRSQGEDATVLRSVQDRLGGDLEDWVVDYLPIRSNDPGIREKSAIVVAARRDAVVGYLETLRRSGLEVEALEIGPVAIRRLVASLGGEEGRANSLVINFGRTHSYISIVWGRRLLINREVGFGEDAVVQRLSDHLDLPPPDARSLALECGVFFDHADPWGRDLVGTDEEAANAVMEILKPALLPLVDEVNKALIYTSSVMRGGSIDKVYLFGSIARWPGADRLLQAVLALPAEIPNPFQAFPVRGEPADVLSDNRVANVALAAGFALRGMLDDG